MKKLDSSKSMWEKCWESQSFSKINVIDYGRKIYARALKKLFQDQIHPDAEFLELGCGTAALGTIIASSIKKYTGFDIATNALASAKKKFKTHHIENYQLEEKDIFHSSGEKKFDVVFSQGLVEHFENTSEVIDIHLKHCKKGGMVYLTVPARFSYHFIWHVLTRPKFMRRFWPWADCIFLTKKDFKKSMTQLTEQYEYFVVQYLPPSILGVLVLIIKK